MKWKVKGKRVSNLNYKEKGKIVDKLIKLMEKSLLNANQKKVIRKIVNNLENTTEIQKDRFILFYGLDEERCETRKLREIAVKYNCTTTAIRRSVITVKNKLSRLEKDVKLIAKVIQECKINN